jgi:hypothetical protein
VGGNLTYNAFNFTATFDANAPLNYNTTYTATVVGGSSGVKDTTGSALPSNYSWSFSVTPSPSSGPGGPILIVTTTANPFSTYYAEILRAEGLNEFATMDLSAVTSTVLSSYSVVLLGQTALTATQTTMFTNYVNGGGNLIAMRPDKQLATLLGLTSTTGTLSNAYLLINTGAGPGVGLVNQTIQFHDVADQYTLSGATSLATLYSDAATATSNPAATLRSVGTNGGQAAAFTFDLAKSIVYTRQGNPAWSGQHRDGNSTTRADDLFFGNASFDPQPDWIDLNKVAIPQADEEQRLLANLITQMEMARMPLPRFWYLPNGASAVIMMTGDDHNNGGTAGRFDNYLSSGTSGGQVIRSSSYLVGAPITDAQAASYTAQGFEVGFHPYLGTLTTGRDWTSFTDLDSVYTTQLNQFATSFPSIPSPSSSRIHWLTWSDYDTQPQVELKHRIRLDTNYYYWPNTWVQNRPGMFTGSAMPMRFSTASGNIIDTYQAATQMTDESGQSYPFTVNSLLDNATGPNGYYGVYTVNAHTDQVSSVVSDSVVASAKNHNVPIMSGRQVLDFLDGRNGSYFSGISFNTTNDTLTFSIAMAAAATGLQAMVPFQSAVGPLTNLTKGGVPVSYSVQTIKGVKYAFFNAGPGTYTAQYLLDTTSPTVIAQSPAPGTNNVATSSPVQVTFSKSVIASSIVFTLKDASGNPIASSVSYDDTTHVATLTPTSSLANLTTYTATVSGAKDAAGNVMTSPVSWSFTTAMATYNLWSPTATPAVVSDPDGKAVELGVKFRTDVAGQVSGIRFYKGSTNTGTHVGSLWTSTGTLLASVTFTGESASGWQQANFSSPVTINPNTTYVISYHTNVGHYSDTDNFFSVTGADSGPLHALANGVDGPNGVFAYSAGSTFPNSAASATNYWVDVIFTAADTTSPTVVTQSPLAGATNVATNTPIKATFSKSVVASSIVFTLKDGAGNPVTASLAYDDPTRTATLTPSALLAPATTFTATVSGAKDSSGNVMAPVSWSFTTEAAPALTSQTPASGATNVATTSTVQAVFNKAIQSSTLSFALKDASGATVASTVAYNASTNTATLTPNAALANATTYTATVSGAKDSSGNTMAPVSWSFTTVAALGPTITATTPAAGATSVATNTTVQAVFSKAVVASTISFTLKDAANNPVTGSVVYNATTNTATFTPSASLANSTTYTATVSGAQDSSGNTMTPVSWSFTTAAATPTGLVAAYAFSEGSGTTVSDQTGKGHTGTLTNATWSTAGKYGNALSFNGTNAWVTIADAADLDLTTGMTVEAWVQPTVNASKWSVAVIKEQPSDPANDLSYALYAANGASNPPSVHGLFGSGGGADKSAVGTSTLPINTWTHLAGTYDGTALRLYVNGVLAATLAQAGSLTTTTGALRIGGDASNEFFTGLIDEVRVYNRALSQTEIQTDMGTPLANPPSVTSQSPANGATNVATNGTVQAVFNKAVVASTISFTLKDAANNPVSGTVAYNATTNTATFTPSALLGTSTTYTATVSGAQDSSGNTMSPVSWSFTTEAAPALTSKTPASGATNVATTSTVQAVFNKAIQSSTLSFVLKDASGATVASTVAYNASTNTATLTPNALLATATTFTATVSGAKDASGNLMAPVSWSFSTEAAPALTSQTPTSGATNVATNTTVQAVFNKAIVASTLAFVLKDASGATVASSVAYNATTNTATLTPSVLLAPATIFTATVSGAKDSSGNTMAPVSWSFTTEAAPALTSQTPASGATNVATTSTVQAVFNKAIQSSTLSFVLKDAGGATVASTVAYNASTNTATLTPNAALANATTYTATVSGAKDSSGNTMTPVSWSFTTVAAPGPTITTTTPAAGATNVATNTTVQAVFNKAVVASTISFTLKDAANNPVSGSVAYNATTNTATFTPSALLATSTTFTATVSGAQDSSGNTMAPVSWSFTTEAAPAVASQTPTAGATNVATNTTVKAVFNKSVVASSISFVLKDPSGTTITSTVAYDDPTRTVTLTPATVLANGTVYAATLSGVKDASGNVLANPVTWSFTTATSTGPFTIWPSTATPVTAADPDTGAVELGVKFQADVSGNVTGIRFYKSTTNTGTHIGNLWTSTGTLLATATFSGETTSGWQQVLFSTPVAITANTTYVASYHTNVGHYAADANYFAVGVDSPPLHALKNGVDGPNGVYAYGSTSKFPNQTYNASNYWVDVVVTKNSGTGGADGPLSVPTNPTSPTVSTESTVSSSTDSGTSSVLADAVHAAIVTSTGSTSTGGTAGTSLATTSSSTGSDSTSTLSSSSTIAVSLPATDGTTVSTADALTGSIPVLKVTSSSSLDPSLGQLSLGLPETKDQPTNNDFRIDGGSV